MKSVEPERKRGSGVGFTGAQFEVERTECCAVVTGTTSLSAIATILFVASSDSV